MSVCLAFHFECILFYVDVDVFLFPSSSSSTILMLSITMSLSLDSLEGGFINFSLLPSFSSLFSLFHLLGKQKIVLNRMLKFHQVNQAKAKQSKLSSETKSNSNSYCYMNMILLGWCLALVLCIGAVQCSFVRFSSVHFKPV